MLHLWPSVLRVNAIGPDPLFRLLSLFLFGIIWSLVVGLAASLSYLSTPGFAFRLVYPSLTR